MKFAPLFILICLLIGGCKKDEATPDPKDVAISQLTAHAWRLGSVSIDDVDKSSTFTGFTITFTKDGFTTTNGNNVWPASGTWTFTDATATKIKRNDGTEVSITELNDASLKLSLTWTGTLAPSRVSSIKGNYKFGLVK